MLGDLQATIVDKGNDAQKLNHEFSQFGKDKYCELNAAIANEKASQSIRVPIGLQ